MVGEARDTLMSNETQVKPQPSAISILVLSGGTERGVRRLLRPHPNRAHLEGVQGSRGGVRPGTGGDSGQRDEP